jgi:hypothetical protein
MKQILRSRLPALNRSLTLLLGAAFPSCGANGLLIILIDQSSIQPTFE